MRRIIEVALLGIIAMATLTNSTASAYLIDRTLPRAGGCPTPELWNLSVAAPLNRQWSTSLPSNPATLVTSATAGTAAQLDEIEQAITASFGAWSGVSGTTFNATNYPGLIAPIARVTAANSCTNDQESNIDGLNTICFNQSSDGFTTGVLAFTRVIAANAPGATAGASGPASFAGQILDADTYFRNDGQATFATPAALATAPGAYDLESLLIHELGHWLALDHSPVWRSIMFPFAPPPGQFLGNRPTVQAPDGPLADDDRAGVRSLYPDPNDATNVGGIQGRVIPANPFSLALDAAPSSGSAVTGIFGAHVVAVDASSGAVIAGTLAGWRCNPASPGVQFDGSFDIERLPIGHNYMIYAEPLTGLAVPDNFSGGLDDLCAASGPQECTVPAVNTNFNPQIMSGSP